MTSYIFFKTIKAVKSNMAFLESPRKVQQIAQKYILKCSVHFSRSFTL